MPEPLEEYSILCKSLLNKDLKRYGFYVNKDESLGWLQNATIVDNT
jgi:hypothetical protein